MSKLHKLNRHFLRAGILASALSAPLLPTAAADIPTKTAQESSVSWTNAPTQTISAGGVDFAYRELGKQNGGPPVVLLNHLAAVLDNWDPRVVDGIAAKHHVIVFDNRGVG